MVSFRLSLCPHAVWVAIIKVIWWGEFRSLACPHDSGILTHKQFYISFALPFSIIMFCFWTSPGAQFHWSENGVFFGANHGIPYLFPGVCGSSPKFSELFELSYSLSVYRRPMGILKRLPLIEVRTGFVFGQYKILLVLFLFTQWITFESKIWGFSSRVQCFSRCCPPNLFHCRFLSSSHAAVLPSIRRERRCSVGFSVLAAFLNWIVWTSQ